MAENQNAQTRRTFLEFLAAALGLGVLAGCATTKTGVPEWTGTKEEASVKTPPTHTWSVSDGTKRIHVNGQDILIPKGVRILDISTPGSKLTVVPGGGRLGWDKDGNPAIALANLITEDGEGWEREIAKKFSVRRDIMERLGFFYELKKVHNGRKLIDWPDVFGSLGLKVEPSMPRPSSVPLLLKDVVSANFEAKQGLKLAGREIVTGTQPKFSTARQVFGILRRLVT